ncbi:hypothetical protein PspLS_06729 [Pyricularia sp. CBS 133598]|nr:hypothetical protein PspLS_06729 [Pyricularia sp. CBS 133598]
MVNGTQTEELPEEENALSDEAFEESVDELADVARKDMDVPQLDDDVEREGRDETPIGVTHSAWGKLEREAKHQDRWYDEDLKGDPGYYKMIEKQKTGPEMAKRAEHDPVFAYSDSVLKLITFPGDPGSRKGMESVWLIVSRTERGTISAQGPGLEASDT